MTAGFEINNQIFWGTNGAVEAYVSELAALSASHLGPDAALSVFLQDESDGFYSGKILFLDERLTDTHSRKTFLGLLDLATEKLLRDGAFTDSGVEWVSSVIADFRNALKAAQNHTDENR